MKKIVLILLLCLFALALIAATENNEQKLSYTLNGFSRVENEGIAEITILQGDSYSISFTCDDSTFKQLIYEVKDSVLLITQTENIQYNDKYFCKIEIVTPTLTSVKNSGIGGTNINFVCDHHLDIENSGLGKMQANVTAKSLLVTNKGVGSIILEGKTDFLKISNEGIGNIRGKNMISETADVNNIGIGNIDVYADSTITVSNDSFGKVNIFGNPKNQELNGEKTNDDEKKSAIGKKDEKRKESIGDKFLSRREKKVFSTYIGTRLGFNNYLDKGKFAEGIAKVKSGKSLESAIVLGGKWKIAKRFFLNTELTFSWYNFKFSDPTVRYAIDSTGAKTLYNKNINTEYKMSKLTGCYVNLELCPTVKIAKRLSIGAGGYVGYNIDNYYKYVEKNINATVKSKEKIECFSVLRYGVKAELTYSFITLYAQYDFSPLYNNIHYEGKEIKVMPLTCGLKITF